MLRRFLIIGVLLLALNLEHPRLGVSATSRAANYARQGQPVAVRAFFDAYNRYDLVGALASLDAGHRRHFGQITTCDYAFFRESAGSGRPSDPPGERLALVKRWLRARFAEHDHYDILDIGAGGPGQPTLISMDAIRSNDALAAAGIVADHVRLNLTLALLHNDHIDSLVDVASQVCPLHSSESAPMTPASPSTARTKALITEFVDAYDGRQLLRALGLFDQTPQYVDCSQHGTDSLSGRSAVGRRLRFRFGQRDHLVVQAVRFGDPLNPTIAAVDAVRSGHSGASVKVGFKVVTNVAGNRLHAIVSELC